MARSTAFDAEPRSAPVDDLGLVERPMTDSCRCDAVIAIVVVVTILLEGPWGLFSFLAEARSSTRPGRQLE